MLVGAGICVWVRNKQANRQSDSDRGGGEGKHTVWSDDVAHTFNSNFAQLRRLVKMSVTNLLSFCVCNTLERVRARASLCMFVRVCGVRENVYNFSIY